MLVVWPAEDQALVILVAPHDESTDDVYAAALDALELEVSQAEREKPPCCDEEGRPPADLDLAVETAGAVERHARARRRAQ